MGIEIWPVTVIDRGNHVENRGMKDNIYSETIGDKGN
jgi:hypothetical protein